MFSSSGTAVPIIIFINFTKDKEFCLIGYCDLHRYIFKQSFSVMFLDLCLADYINPFAALSSKPCLLYVIQ